MSSNFLSWIYQIKLLFTLLPMKKCHRCVEGRGQCSLPLTASTPTFHRLWQDVAASLWPLTYRSLPGPELMHHSSHTSLLVCVQNSGAACTGLKEIFQRLWMVVLNVVVRTPPTPGRSM